LNRIAGKTWTQGTVGFYRIVNHVPDGSPTLTPAVQEPGDIRFRVRIIALPPTRIEERLLDIDYDKRGGLR
jgi:hypothetical protein